VESTGGMDIPQGITCSWTKTPPAGNHLLLDEESTGGMVIPPGIPTHKRRIHGR
jgi:hypothetical protein